MICVPKCSAERLSGHIEGVVRSAGGWCVPPVQTVAQDVEDPAEDSPVIHSRLAPRLGKCGRSR